MAVVKPVIFQVVGFQNSGKTTFLKNLINMLSKESIKVVTIKHHGHGGKPEVPEAKDSSQHIEAGAVVSLVEGEGRLILQAEMETFGLVEKIQLISFFKPDIILIEGHKFEDYPKAVIIRNEEDVTLLNKLKNVQVIYFWDEELMVGIEFEKIPSFHKDDPNGIDWLMGSIKDFQLKNV
ncbi:molybdopterin-guanine dinucleotide biosynthesis protein B [Bacillus sp. 31A1R]|uniref:Molybdopterin-guanine dinucleotide biosynthesis protein B n=1 Tax=Robertmurraya mangrovi TaxID=3098077 RepID=A0ABU5IT44_9BACI|nr:molybdopterin-guanine dinucleotide biosynthesis protein B [Bacillus sp. 31A1R]MDZ5470315.1 molybdopterin-guanine dinucleotide biosynthesis protein B [Bacillus sp. 31A1R]